MLFFKFCNTFSASRLSLLFRIQAGVQGGADLQPAARVAPRLLPLWTADGAAEGDPQEGILLLHGLPAIEGRARLLVIFLNFATYHRLLGSTILFTFRLESKVVRICSLPRESHLVFSLYGRRTVQQKETLRRELTELGWGAIQLFNFEK